MLYRRESNMVWLPDEGEIVFDLKSFVKETLSIASSMAVVYVTMQNIR